MNNNYTGPERRKFQRLSHAVPLDYKICKKETISKLLQGYTSNVSTAGLQCNVKEKVGVGDVLWLCFDRATLHICEELEKRALIYQNGIIGKVVRAEHKDSGHYNIGVHFITREEKNQTHIYPKIHFIEENLDKKNEEN